MSKSNHPPAATDMASGTRTSTDAHAGSTMSKEQIKVLGIATFGGMLEYFEFVIFIFLSPFISQYFFPQDMPDWLRQVQTLGIFAAGYLVRPVGGIVLASIGDRIGRKKMFAFTLTLLAVPTILIGLLPGYAQIGVLAPLLLLLCRMVQGLSIGGELPGALCFVAESVPEKKLGLSCGILAGSLALGALLGSVCVAALTGLLGKEAMYDYGWRIPFIVGGVFGLASAYLRRFAHETPVFEQMRAQNLLAKQIPVKLLLSKHKPALLLCTLVACMTAAVTAGVHLFPVPYFITQLQFEPVVVLQAQFWATVALIAGDILFGMAADRFGLRKTFVGGVAVFVLSLFWLYTEPTQPALLVRYATVGFLSGCVCMTFVLLISSFPAQVRYTGIAASYNIAAAVVGGLTPLVLSLLTRQNPMWAAYLPALFCAAAVMAAFALHRYRRPIHELT